MALVIGKWTVTRKCRSNPSSTGKLQAGTTKKGCNETLFFNQTNGPTKQSKKPTKDLQKTCLRPAEGLN